MRFKTHKMVAVCCGLLAGCAVAAPHPTSTPYALRTASRDYIVIPDSTNSVQFRLYTNASPDAAGVFNTFDMEAYGETLLQSPGPDALKKMATYSVSATLHSIVINGRGPNSSLTNGMTIVESASGPEWKYVALDVTSAYRDQLKQYRRGILFVEPGLFVLWDHLVAKDEMSFKMFMHPPAATRVDSDWHDLRLELPRAGIEIGSPAARKQPRDWEPVKSDSDMFLPDTVTMQLGPTNKLATLDVLTVFAVHRTGEKMEVAFRLLESTSAIGARIYRNGYPTLVAFKTDFVAPEGSLTGFRFVGPVGVDVFKPKQTASPQ